MERYRAHMARPSKREETRQRLVDAGIAALQERGLTVGLDSVSLETAYIDADVPRSSAYAAWAEAGEATQTPQEAFRRAVLFEAIRHPVDDDEIHETTQEMAEVDISGLHGTPEQRAATRQELIRIAGAANARTVQNSWRWWITSAVHSSLASLPEGERDEELLSELARIETEFEEDSLRSIHQPYMELFNYRPRFTVDGGDSMRAYTMLASALGEGLARRYLFPTSPHDPMAVRLDGDDNPWTLFALGLDALISFFFEETPPGDHLAAD